MLIRLAALALLAVAPALAAPVPVAPGTGGLAGLVTDADTGDPLIGANIYISAEQRGPNPDAYERPQSGGVHPGSCCDPDERGEKIR